MTSPSKKQENWDLTISKHQKWWYNRNITGSMDVYPETKAFLELM
jgi:hypothetical protein